MKKTIVELIGAVAGLAAVYGVTVALMAICNVL